MNRPIKALGEIALRTGQLEAMWQFVQLSEHAWVHWRSLYINDPHGNVVEWVCYDDTVG